MYCLHGNVLTTCRLRASQILEEVTAQLSNHSIRTMVQMQSYLQNCQNLFHDYHTQQHFFINHLIIIGCNFFYIIYFVEFFYDEHILTDSKLNLFYIMF